MNSTLPSNTSLTCDIIRNDDYYDMKLIEKMDKDGYMVFEKVIKDESDYAIYNPDYFASIGHPNAIITLEKRTQNNNNNVMSGGYYENVHELSWPFSQFVYLVQGRGNRKAKEEIDEESDNTGIYGRFFGKREKILEETKSPMAQEVSSVAFEKKNDNPKQSSAVFNGFTMFANTVSGIFKPNRPVKTEESEPAVEAKPVVVEPEPAVVKPEPVVIEQKPVVVEPEPAVVKPEPVVIEQKPVVVEPEQEKDTRKYDTSVPDASKRIEDVVVIIKIPYEEEKSKLLELRKYKGTKGEKIKRIKERMENQERR